LVYNFTTTCRSPEDALNECMRKMDEVFKDDFGSFKVYVKENGTLTRIFRTFRNKALKNEKPIILPEDYLDIRTEKKDFKREIREKKWMRI